MLQNFKYRFSLFLLHLGIWMLMAMLYAFYTSKAGVEILFDLNLWVVGIIISLLGSGLGWALCWLYLNPKKKKLFWVGHSVATYGTFILIVLMLYSVEKDTERDRTKDFVQKIMGDDFQHVAVPAFQVLLKELGDPNSFQIVGSGIKEKGDSSHVYFRYKMQDRIYFSVINVQQGKATMLRHKTVLADDVEYMEELHRNQKEGERIVKEVTATLDSLAKLAEKNRQP